MSQFKFNTNDNFPLTNEVFKGLQDEIEVLKMGLLLDRKQFPLLLFWLKKPTTTEDGFVYRYEVRSGRSNSPLIVRVEKGNYAPSDVLKYQIIKSDVTSDTGNIIKDFEVKRVFTKIKAGQTGGFVYSDIKERDTAYNGGVYDTKTGKILGETVQFTKTGTGIYTFTWANTKHAYYVIQVLPNKDTVDPFIYTVKEKGGDDFEIRIYNHNKTLMDADFTIIYKNY